jgi:glycosyltransferase involved in cell wall biosynthesis
MENGHFNVMQIISNLETGGAQEVVRTLSEYLAASGHAPVVCTFKDGPLRQEIERLGIPVEVLPGRRHSILSFPGFLSDMVRIRRELARLVEKHNIHIIQTHLLRSLDYLVLTLRFNPRRLLVFWTIHNSNFALRADKLPNFKWLLGPKLLGYRLLYLLSSRWVNGFIAISEDVETAILQTIGPVRDKVAVICNGVDVRRYRRAADRVGIRRQLGVPEDACLMAVVGTLKEQKGHRFLIEAAQEPLSQFPNLHLLFIGDGILRETLQARVRECRLDGRIHFLGNRSDVPDLLAASDLFVLPSLWEGLPMALIEAMASGLPIIATAVSGSQQVMVPGQTGLLVSPGDASELREAILELLSNPKQAKIMGAAAQRRVETSFSATKQAEEHVELYQQAWYNARGAEI